ncbi:formin-like protein 11 [Cucumis melo var. makuwa]|uniref:Formin-like protein 11 n=1 Tax=Cucumis melo var. makuwa TaxID=1194695 RepID=A0A5A7T7X3_CUCMM|nr:formin-like protein 11 [Cucumis melo var. makuwa]
MEKLSVKSEREDKTARPKSSLDLFDLGMLGMDVEEQTHTSESEKELSVHKEGERSEEMLDSKFDNVSVSSTKEVMYAREEDDSKSIQCVSNGTHSSSGDKITLVQCCLSNDEESFHSCGDSNFLNRRLSNASETSSANVITNSTCSVPTANLASWTLNQFFNSGSVGLKEQDVISESSGFVERTYQSSAPEGYTYQSSVPGGYTYQSSAPEGRTYQSSVPGGYTYQSSAPEGCTYQSSVPGGYTYQSSTPEGCTYP